MKSCFGTIYPDLEKLKFGKPLAGKVFQICVDSQGPGHRDRKLAIDGKCMAGLPAMSGLCELP